MMLRKMIKKKKDNSLESTLLTISRVSQRFSHGQAYRLFLEGADIAQSENEPIKKARTPGHFSDTRFAMYSYEVFRKWLHNYEFYYRRLNRENDDELSNIDHAPFMFLCAGFRDIYEVIGKFSNAV